MEDAFIMLVGFVWLVGLPALGVVTLIFMAIKGTEQQ